MKCAEEETAASNTRRLGHDRPGMTISVYRLPQGSGVVLPGPERTLVWNGRDENGRAVPPGIYVAFLDAGPRRLTQRIALVR